MKQKLLAIDDEHGVLAMIEEHFALRGFEVATALDGSDGVHKCEIFQPDVILLDLKMRRFDGDEILPRLRALVPQARIFVVSAYPDDLASSQLVGVGADDYFEKPISILDLEHTVKASVA